MEISSVIEWGTIIYSLFMFGLLLLFFGFVVNFVIKFFKGSKRNSSQLEELNKKMDQILELQKKNKD